MSSKYPMLFITAMLAWLGFGQAALAHEGFHLPRMTHPHVEVHHLVIAGLMVLVGALALARRGG
jgi:hypothetical protein